MMFTILAYALVIVLVQFCLTLGTMIVGFLIALCLMWLPAQVRAAVTGILAGIAGVTTAVVFGYFTFRFVAGDSSYGIGAFLASTVPLVIPIINDRRHALQLAAAEMQLPDEARAIAVPTTAVALNTFFGYLIGILLATYWFFFHYEKIV